MNEKKLYSLIITPENCVLLNKKVMAGALTWVMGTRYMGSKKIFPAGVVSFMSFIMTGGYIHGIMRSLH